MDPNRKDDEIFFLVHRPHSRDQTVEVLSGLVRAPPCCSIWDHINASDVEESYDAECHLRVHKMRDGIQLHPCGHRFLVERIGCDCPERMVT